MMGWRRRRSRTILGQEEAFWLVVACPSCPARPGEPCSAQMGYRVQPHAERIAARRERDRAALAFFASLVRAADPLLSAYGYENEDRRVEGGWAHWQHEDGPRLALRVAQLDGDPFASLQADSIQEDLRVRLHALGVRSYCPECGSTRHWEPLASCIRD